VTDDVRGASAALVRRALADRDPLPGTTGFAGAIDAGNGDGDGTETRSVDTEGSTRLVRDVLGRQPLFSTPDAGAWSRDPADLSTPVPVPAGHVRTARGDERVWTLPDPPPSPDHDAATARVRRAIRSSLREVRRDDGSTGDVAVAFSGGVDSAIVAAGLPDAPLYVAGFDGAHDVAAARRAAAAMGRAPDLDVVGLDHDAIRAAVPRVARATGRTNPMDVAIALPLVLVAERVAADGYDRLAVGQGADELFGGYAKVAKAPDDPRVDADTIRAARRETILDLPDQLERDVLALRAAGVEPVAPLLHDRVVAAALSLPGPLLVADGVRKVALREAARDLPEDVRTADKKAVQYGTYVSRELDRLARRAGFKRRLDDHVGRYVRTLCLDAGVRVPDASTDPLPGAADPLSDDERPGPE
jgi:asparagine synthase (glutamine-hydrolysing)